MRHRKPRVAKLERFIGFRPRTTLRQMILLTAKHQSRAEDGE
jgi:hypothetical protein